MPAFLPERATGRVRAERILLVAVLLTAGLALVPSHALAEGRKTSPATVTYDLLIERPIGLVELIVGAAMLPVAYPIAAAGDAGSVVVDQCVRTPGRSTFTRALGRLDDDRRSGCSPVAFGFEMTQLSLGAALKPLGWIFGGSPFSRSRGADEGVEI